MTIGNSSRGDRVIQCVRNGRRSDENAGTDEPGAVVRREALRPEGHAERASIDQYDSAVQSPLAWPALPKRRSTTAPGRMMSFMVLSLDSAV